MCAESHTHAWRTKYAGGTHVHTNTLVQSVAQMIGCDVIIANLFSEKDSSDYDQSQAFLVTLH